MLSLRPPKPGDKRFSNSEVILIFAPLAVYTSFTVTLRNSPGVPLASRAALRALEPQDGPVKQCMHMNQGPAGLLVLLETRGEGGGHIPRRGYSLFEIRPCKSWVAEH